MTDIRWHQRLNNFSTALRLLEGAVTLAQARELSDLEKQGMIQAFEFTHELAWNVMKDYVEFQGQPGITGSRDAARESFQRGLIADGEAWMEMIKSRNQTSHTYNKKTAEEIVGKVQQQYFPAFKAFEQKMKSLAERK